MVQKAYREASPRHASPHQRLVFLTKQTRLLFFFLFCLVLDNSPPRKQCYTETLRGRIIPCQAPQLLVKGSCTGMYFHCRFDLIILHHLVSRDVLHLGRPLTTVCVQQNVVSLQSPSLPFITQVATLRKAKRLPYHSNCPTLQTDLAAVGPSLYYHLSRYLAGMRLTRGGRNSGVSLSLPLS